MYTKKPIIRTVVTFAALTIAGISLTVTAQVVPNAFAQSVLVAVGSAIFGAGLVFFLMRMFALTEI